MKREAKHEPFPLDEIKERILGVLSDIQDLKPEPGASWEGWYYAAFDDASVRIGELLDQIPADQGLKGG